MVMDTANKNKRPQGYVLVPALVSLLLSPAVLAEEEELAQGWQVTPRLTLSETFTDNIELEPDGDADLVTEVSPGVNLSKQGGRSRVEFDYELQGLLFADTSSSNDINHKLFGAGQFELKPDWFYLDTLATYTQRNTNQSGRLSLDTVTGAGDLDDVGTLRISPYLVHDFGGQVEVLARYTRDEIRYESGGASDSSADGADINLASGRFWRVVTWSLNHNRNRISRSSAPNASFESTRADVAYRLTDSFRLLARAGNEDNDYPSSRQVENGSYVAGGALWRPSRYYAMEALYGEEYKTATLRLNPTRRTDVEITYYDRDVGTLLGAAWDARIRHRGPALTLSATYNEDTTTVQQAELERGYLDLFTGEVSFDQPQPGSFFLPVDVLVLTDEIIERKRASGTASYDTGRSTFTGRIFNERRLFLTSRTTERVNGGDAAWRWAYDGTTDFILRGGLVNTLRASGTQDDRLWFAQWSVEHDFTPRARGSLELRRTEQESDRAANEYEENRITARVRMEF
ncbi:signal transduction histidine kinase [Thiohalobacter thiocyanaticus]|uniref:Signal transduction histidine kinase n=2 Tax=Thiohalobacter thiocyanaticus TaxID=585455 RepID=A0A1Z4VU27_9GAMM|nr:signal transduction histidine kinase [Thiohalobacter thiocyanaticus]